MLRLPSQDFHRIRWNIWHTVNVDSVAMLMAVVIVYHVLTAYLEFMSLCFIRSWIDGYVTFDAPRPLS
jgi:hypothetical protein